MKIFRGPRSTRHWSQTDAQAVGDWASDWTPDAALQLDGTIDKTGERHTVLGVQVEPDDVLSLAKGMFAYYRAECDRLSALVGALHQGISDVHSMAKDMRESAPSHDELLDAIEELAWHYTFCPEVEPPRRDWEASVSDGAV